MEGRQPLDPCLLFNTPGRKGWRMVTAIRRLCTGIRGSTLSVTFLIDVHSRYYRGRSRDQAPSHPLFFPFFLGGGAGGVGLSS